MPFGVGALAAGLAAPLWQRYNKEVTTLITVESLHSCCFLDSIKSGELAAVDIKEETVMAGLSCGEVSPIAWEVLKPCTKFCMSINDDSVRPLMRWFASKGIQGGECSTSGLAALLQARMDTAKWTKLGFNSESVVVLIGTEGATDVKFYDEVVNGAN